MNNIITHQNYVFLKEDLMSVKRTLACIALLKLDDESANACRAAERALETQIAELARGFYPRRKHICSTAAEPARRHQHLRLVYDAGA